MTNKLDVHPASLEERIQIYRNIFEFEFWKMAPSVEEHVQLRLKSTKHNRAKWYAGCLNGQVVVSLGCYPLSYYFKGEEITGISIGSVHTLPLFRRKGFAKQLILWVEKEQKQKGAKISSLYSDIPPQYYSKIGYLQCPSWESWLIVNDTRTTSKSFNWNLERFSPTNVLEKLNQIYSSYHNFIPLGISRPLTYWEFLISKKPNDEFYWLKKFPNQNLGYVRLTRAGNDLQISDFAVNQHLSDLLEKLFGLIIKFAREKGFYRVGGWLPDEPVIRSLFKIQPRAHAITMVKSLGKNLTIEPEHIATADHFSQIDHV